MVWLIRAELFVAGDFTGHSDRIYTTFILSTALQNFGTRANSFGHGPLDLHDKICSSFFNVYYWNGTPETRTALKFVSPCTYMTAVHMWFQSRFRNVRGAFMGCSKKKLWQILQCNKHLYGSLPWKSEIACHKWKTKQGHPLQRSVHTL